MYKLDAELMSKFYGKDLIAYGTGISGKCLITCLAQIPGIKLHGVTDSEISAADAGSFLDTGLPLRSIGAWSKLMPNATILVAAAVFRSVDEIKEMCRQHGFQEFITVPYELLSAATEYTAAAMNIRALQQLETFSDQIIMTSPIFKAQCLANELHDVHKAAFSQFKGCHKGKTVAVVATGPSLNYYSQLQGVLHIGVNGSFLKKEISLDYYFLFHYVREWCNQLKDYNFIKFFARNMKSSKDVIPEYLFEENHARKFYIGRHGKDLHTELEYYPLIHYFSIIFAALQFALYTRPSRILLIGCDCTSGAEYTHFYDGKASVVHSANNVAANWTEGYQKIKNCCELYYPDTEIISINPVGLKGMFRDVYTESYLRAYPEIDPTQVEILDSEKHDF